MPGMMDTILNLGLNDETVVGLAKKTGNERFAYDSYRRLIQMFGDVVMGVEHDNFEKILDDKKHKKNLKDDTELSVEDLKDIVKSFKNLIKKDTGKDFPQDVTTQLWDAISAVFDSWMNERAVVYRKINNIPEEWGTAVNVQAMVFGNMGNDCATGVAFTRNPSTGIREFFGEYLINAQGEDVVAGIRTPQQITKKGRKEHSSELPSMEETMPEVYKELVKTYHILEEHYKDMQDIEFTIQNNKLWMLQTRNAKRTARAAVKIAVDMVKEGLITKEEAIMRVDPESLNKLLHPTLDPNAKKKTVGKGLPASPGAACGIIVFSSIDAELKAETEKVILVRIETSPEDIKGMYVSQGILTTRGGMTSHAAVVARGMGVPCVSGACDIKIDYTKKKLTAWDIEIKEGDKITIDGSTGEIILGEVPTVEPSLDGEFGEIMKWADEIRTLKVRANAETPEDARTARRFGAEGIGLCRTEHMFFNENRILSVREMIVAKTEAERRKALAKLLPMQREDFVSLFEIMDDLPVTIRFLDPPLHEFLPHKTSEIEELAKVLKINQEDLTRRIESLKEANPMLGHRGCRLGISYPEIYEMQARAVFEACAERKIKTCVDTKIEIMIPLVATKKELEISRDLIISVQKQVEKEKNLKFNVIIGTMIELPRAALIADKIAEYAEFFSFGTNDLTQTTFGLSRDDSGNFLEDYKNAKIFKKDPFESVDVEGVGQLIDMACKKGKSTRQNIKLGVCGEHGGDPDSIEFFHSVGLNYVSCSPYRIPIARLAAARAKLKSDVKS
jgi:pyruvate,orthophosphate dikinase